MPSKLTVVKRDGSKEPFEIEKIYRVMEWAAQGDAEMQSALESKLRIEVFDGIKTADIQRSLINCANELTTVENPGYCFVAARLVLQTIFKEVTNGKIEYPELEDYIKLGIAEGRLSPKLCEEEGFNLPALNAAIIPANDLLFDYHGIKTLKDRYLIRQSAKKHNTSSPKIIEMPQHMWMRIAMGLALSEKPENRTHWAIKFYEVLSNLWFVNSTPTLFNSGTMHPQMSSCYLNTVPDSLTGIYETISECAQLSKFAGGIGTDWTYVRGEGSYIDGTNGRSSGVVPYLKVFNDTAVAVNQGGKRKGSFAAYLEPWHPDIFMFMDLKKSTGEERMRCHDIYPVCWIPDLFMKRVKADMDWSLFCPHKLPELHELYGEAFEKRYVQLEAEGRAVRTVKATEIWKTLISRLFETGAPWVTFKDRCNEANPQRHVGVIHNSNLCTEITLNTSETETAVCNLGSVNMSRISTREAIADVVPIAIRMLDNVIDGNFYPSEKSRNSNMKHRPIGLGVMGYAEFLAMHGVAWESEEHLEVADEYFEALSYHAIKASAELAQERGSYESFEGSNWSKGVLPMDHSKLKGDAGIYDWAGLRSTVAKGMRNSNVMAIAPTATIGIIAGTTPCIEMPVDRVEIRENLAGTIAVLSPCLKYEGNEKNIPGAFDADQKWAIKAAARRQRWVDQSQSLNLFVDKGVRGRDLSDMYFFAWEQGLKTTYYLKFRRHMDVTSHQTDEAQTEEPKMCSIDNPDCESCQ